MLEYTKDIETLDLRLYRAAAFRSAWFLPPFPSLKRLVLHNFIIKKQALEEELLPWCFKAKVHTLHLANTQFATPLGVTKIGFFRWHLARDISRPTGPDYETKKHHVVSDQGISGTQMPGGVSREDGWSSTDGSEEHLTDDDNDDSHPLIPFMEVEFRSDSEDNDSDYFPCTSEIWSRHLDAPVCDDSAEGSVKALADVCYEYYHPDVLRAYDDDYEHDTPPIEGKFPIPRLQAAEARMLPSVANEGVELKLSGTAWGCGENGLRVLIDNFSSREEIEQDGI
ncbi:hypothetical protein AJ80_09482 [Polytolypa hystricis UAMH7299]|uniref:Uncharacterized protein n=1 Tax=Polytolypa hystricis (strain UAMH7299) TaxID=1447883 RepID=A0A2B7WQ66_POLH7|nr:hypothetical protein AJ80_09482 [Polytolypa hystricis UAMH7299]